MAEDDEYPKFGAELKDAYKSVNCWVSNGIGWLDDIQQFYRERSTIEKEYSAKLNALARKYHEKKAKKSSSLSVGDTPVMTPGSLENASLITWTKQLNTIESRAAEHERYAIELVTELADPLKVLGTRYEELRKRHADHASKLESERDAAFNDLRKVKSKYDTSCQELESKRKKVDSSFDFSKVKAQNAFQQQVLNMHNVKNSYLIAINVANALKERYYVEYIPELLDSLQDLSESRTTKLNEMWSRATELEINMLTRSIEIENHLVVDFGKNQPFLDSMMFIKHNMAPWQEPPDKSFIPSPIWHDDNTMVVDDIAIVYLQNLLSKSKAQLGDLRREADKKRREIESTKRIKQQIREGKDDRDEVEIVRSIFSLKEELHLIDRRRLAAEVETQTITAVVGDVTLGAKSHNFKSQTFKIPTNCDLCGERIWGLSAKGFDCRDCGYACHSKCEMKVPAECPGEQTRDQKKKIKSERQEAVNSLSSATKSLASVEISPDKPMSRSKMASIERVTSQSDKTPKILGKNRIVAPPPINHVNENPTSEINLIQTLKKKLIGEQKGIMKYAYEANGEGEVSVKEESEIIVIEPDDGGWTLIQTLNGESGLVPTAYIKFLATRPASNHSNSSSWSSGQKRQGPPVAPKPGAKKLRYFEVLYDYQAQSDTELSIMEGERLVLIKEDPGDGWAEVEKNGKIGSVPANYIQPVN
ncbi:hypothetical protein HI914_01135 [Erysiphe necator]|nr:hypothetical protein HI914_01135 [Erysiphe necator]